MSLPRRTQSDTLKRLLACFCAFLLVASTLPLYIISLYNHPYYDDYSFSVETHRTWQETGNPLKLLEAAAAKTHAVHNSWQGNYMGTFFSTLQPAIFSESLYFLTTLLLLTCFLLCFGFFLQTVFAKLLGLGKWETVTLISLTLTLLVQFMPDPDEAFFWFNGGIGNTFVYSLLALSLGLCIRLELCRGRGKAAWLLAALTVLMVLLGGGSYGGGIFGLLIYALIVLYAFVKKSRWCWAYALLTAVFLAGFLVSMSAPGNAVRAGIINHSASPVMAVLQSFYYGIAVGVGFIRLPLIALTLFLLPWFAIIAQKITQKIAFRFAHPWLVLVGGICLFCAQFAPPLYSGAFIGGGRIVNVYFQSFVLLWLLYEFYLTGFFLRRREASCACGGQLSNRRQHALLLLCACMALVGAFGHKHPNAEIYGPQNLSGASAALSLLRGEAQQYHQEMTAREVLLNDPDEAEITLKPLTTVPLVFMRDLLTMDSVDDAIPALCLYYDKAIALEGAP